MLVNSTGTGTVGRTRLFHESYLKHYPFVVPDSHVSVIRTASEIKSEFVFAYISSRLIQEYLEDNLAGSTNQKELYIGVLSDLLFPLPPLAEQQRIVTEIEKWFALIDEIEQGKADLQTSIKQTKSKILDLAIHGKLVPQDPSDEPASELLKRINPKAEITKLLVITVSIGRFLKNGVYANWLIYVLFCQEENHLNTRKTIKHTQYLLKNVI